VTCAKRGGEGGLLSVVRGLGGVKVVLAEFDYGGCGGGREGMGRYC